MSKTLAILGAGDLGKQIAHLALSDNHYQKVVFFDDFTSEKEFLNYPVLGKSTNVIMSYNQSLFDELIIGIGYNHLSLKDNLYQSFKDKIPFGKVIHSSAWIDPSAHIGDGVVIYPRVVIDQNVEVKSNSLINLSVTIAHDSVINYSSFLAPSVAISGNVSVGKCCFIGTNTTIRDGISIESFSIVGSGSLVVNNINESGTYFGHPVKKIK